MLTGNLKLCHWHGDSEFRRDIMKSKGIIIFLVMGLLVLNAGWATVHGAELKIIIMQDQMGIAQKYKPLVEYMKQKGIDISFVTAPNYSAAADMFTAGTGSAMFSGSGVAGSLIIKELASPLVRPVSGDGNSTYWAVVIARKGSPQFTGSGDYFKGKKVALTAIASSGEFYVRSLQGHNTASQIMKAASHDAAVDTVGRGAADIAVVKNRVWDKISSKYPNLEKIGEDKGENPDNSLMISKNFPAELAQKLKVAFLEVKNDNSAAAKAVKTGLGIQGYIETSDSDFRHTISLLQNSGVNKSFNFKF
jgi:ABC-type phosphate/phosphonate transport system substrate-binding protein